MMKTTRNREKEKTQANTPSCYKKAATKDIVFLSKMENPFKSTKNDFILILTALSDCRLSNFFLPKLAETSFLSKKVSL